MHFAHIAGSFLGYYSIGVVNFAHILGGPLLKYTSNGSDIYS